MTEVKGQSLNPVSSSAPLAKLSEEKFERLISEVEDYAIIVLDKNGIISTWNRGAERIKGYAAHEIIGKSYKLFYPAEDVARKLPDELLARAEQQGKATHEGWRVKKNGTRFWGNIVVTALHDDQGVVTGFLKVTRDLTERKMAEDKLQLYAHELTVKNEQLKESEQRYHKMISEVQDYAILLMTNEGIILNWNAGAEFIKGYKAEEIVGKSFKVFYQEEDIRAGVPDMLLKEARVKGKASSEGWRKRKDGSKFWGSVVITALHNSIGEIIGFSKVTRDLTEKKKADDDLKTKTYELELKYHELERLNGELSSFAYVVSHDFKEPIRKIQVFGNRQLEPDKSIDEIRKFSEKIVSSAARMQNLMDALLSYSLISNDQSALERIDLNAVLESVKFDLEIAIAEKHAKIESTILPVINGISFQIHQLFLNLVSNALKFSKAGESPVLFISSSRVASVDLPIELVVKNKSYYKISFADNGVGFEQEHASRIFDVFQRLGHLPKAGGTGIGLAIVKKVAVNHDGFVVAESKPEQGATFHVYLPAGL